MVIVCILCSLRAVDTACRVQYDQDHGPCSIAKLLLYTFTRMSQVYDHDRDWIVEHARATRPWSVPRASALVTQTAKRNVSIQCTYIILCLALGTCHVCMINIKYRMLRRMLFSRGTVPLPCQSNATTSLLFDPGVVLNLCRLRATLPSATFITISITHCVHIIINVLTFVRLRAANTALYCSYEIFLYVLYY